MFSAITFWLTSTREGGRASRCCLEVFAICQTTILLSCEIELVVNTWFDNSSELRGLGGRLFEALMRGMPRILLSLCSSFRQQLYKHQRSNYLSRLHAYEANRARNRLVNFLHVNIDGLNFSVHEEVFYCHYHFFPSYNLQTTYHPRLFKIASIGPLDCCIISTHYLPPSRCLTAPRSQSPCAAKPATSC